MSTVDPKIEKLVAAMQKVPEKLAAKWLEATELANNRIAELEKNFNNKVAELDSVGKKLADVEQELQDLKASSTKTITAKDAEIKKLSTELQNLKDNPPTVVSNNNNDELYNIVMQFIKDIQKITDNLDKKSAAVINEVKPTKNAEKTVISEPKTESKKKAESKKETAPAEPEHQMSDEESVDSILTDLGITNL